MSRRLAIVPLVLLFAAACPGADDDLPTLDVDFPVHPMPTLGLESHVVHQLMLSAYLPASMTGGTVNEGDANVGNIAHNLGSSWQPGFAGRIAWQRLAFDGEGDGWFIGLGFAGEYLYGHIDDDTIGGVSAPAKDHDLFMETRLGQLSFGYSRRWDSEAIRAAPHDWQFDVGPVIGAGVGQVRIGRGGWSNIGPAASLGIHFRLSAAVSQHWRIGGELGADYTRARVHWDNTTNGDFDAFGPILGLVLIYER